MIVIMLRILNFGGIRIGTQRGARIAVNRQSLWPRRRVKGVTSRVKDWGYSGCLKKKCQPTVMGMLQVCPTMDRY